MIAGQLEIQMLANMARLQKDMNDAKRHVGGAMDNIQKTAKRTMQVLGGIGAGVSVGLLVNKFAQVATETDKLRGNLVTVTGSADAAGTAFDNLTKFAAQTPFTLDQSVNAFIKLKALGLDPSERALTSYGNTAAAMGMDMNQMIEAVADASTGEFERLKEFGITAKSQGDEVSFTFQGVTNTIGKNSEDIQEYLLGIGETKFGDAMENQMERLPGQLSNLEMSVDGLFRKLADDGGTAIFSAGIGSASSAVQFLTDSTDYLYDAVILVSGVATARLVPSLGTSAMSFVVAQREAIRYQATLATMSGVSARTALAQSALASSTTALRGALALVGGPIGAVTLAVGALGLAYVNLKKRQDEARESMIESFGGQTLREVQSSLNAYTGEIVRLEQKIVDLRSKNLSGDTLGNMAEIIEAQGRIADLRDIVDRLTESLNLLKSQQGETAASTGVLSDSFQTLIDKQAPLLKTMPLLASGIQLVEEGFGVLSPTAQAMSVDLVDMDIILTNLRIGTVPGFNDTLADTGFRMKGVTDATTVNTKELEFHSNMVENVQREWATLIDTFIDGESDIGDFFDTFAKGIKRVIAEAAAADLASLVFGNNTGGNLTGLFSGSGSNSQGGNGSGTGLNLGNLAALGGSTSLSFLNSLPGGTAFLNNSGFGGAKLAGPTQDGSTLTRGFDFKTAGMTLAAGFAGSFAGDELGQALFGKEAESNIGASAGSAIGSALGGPVGAFLGGLLGGAADVAFGGDGFKRSIAGFLGNPTPGAPAGSTFNVDAFASGFTPIGFADGQATRAQALAIMEPFKGLDQAIVDAVVAAGGKVITPAGMNGFDLDGTGVGTLFGKSQRTTDDQFAAQFDSYAMQLVNRIDGLSAETMAQLLGAGSALEIVSILTDLTESIDAAAADDEQEKATEEAARTFAQVGQMIFDSNGALVDSDHNVIASGDQLEAILDAMPWEMQEAVQAAMQGLQGFTEINGMLFNSNGDLINSHGELIASQAALESVMAFLPAEIQSAIMGSIQADPAAVPPASIPGSTRQSPTRVTPVTDIGNAFDNKTIGEIQDSLYIDQMALARGLNLSRAEQDALGLTTEYLKAIDQMMADGVETWDELRSVYTMNPEASRALGIQDAITAMAESMVDGSHAAGLAYVPFDGYVGRLHRGEEVLTRDDPRNQNNSARSGSDRATMQAVNALTVTLNKMHQQWKRIENVGLKRLD